MYSIFSARDPLTFRGHVARRLYTRFGGIDGSVAALLYIPCRGRATRAPAILTTAHRMYRRTYRPPEVGQVVVVVVVAAVVVVVVGTRVVVLGRRRPRCRRRRLVAPPAAL